MKRGARVGGSALAAAALAATVAGCGGEPRGGAASPDAGPMTATRFVIDAPEKTNKGAMLYMMIRVVDDSFAAESYQDAAAKVFGAERDKQILDSRPIFPGRERVTVPVEVGEKSDVAIYFFFTAPQGAWRQTLHHPLPAQIDVELGEHAIARVRPHKR